MRAVAAAGGTEPARRIRLWWMSSSYPRKYSVSWVAELTTNPSRSTQNWRDASQVGDDQLGVGGPDDVGRRGKLHDHAPNRGTWVSPSGMWTMRDSV